MNDASPVGAHSLSSLSVGGAIDQFGRKLAKDFVTNQKGDSGFQGWLAGKLEPYAEGYDNSSADGKVAGAMALGANLLGPGGGIKAVKEERAIVNEVRAINLPGWQKVTVDMEHIAERHMTGGMVTEGRSVFVNLNQQGVMAAVQQAYGSATKVAVQGDRVLLSGTTKTGMTVEMWLNKATNTIETAYPVARK